MEIGNISTNDSFVYCNVWVTLECNFACTYCYENGKKENCYMTKDCADKVIEFIYQICEEEGKDVAWINFHGGEPLLNYEIIKYFVDKLKEENRLKKLYTSLTTNGSIFQGDIKDYICELSVSIDGTKETHDENRLTKNGKGTYDLIIDNCKHYMTEFGNVRVRQVVNPDNVCALYDGIKHLLDLGYRTVIPAIDMFAADWKEEHFTVLEEQLKLVRDYIAHKGICGTTIGILNNKIKKKGKCYVGCDGYQIAADGRIYPCTYVVNEAQYCIGDVYTGIVDEKVENINCLNNKKVDACVGCANYEYCDTPRCLLVNKKLTGDYYSPSAVVCTLENVKLKLQGLL